jgi:hypothetical protein
VRNRWLTGGAIRLHLLAVFVIAICLGAGWWQLQRALGGNNPSWAYTVEWPFFAAYGGWTWWKLLHEEPGFAKEETPTDDSPPRGTGNGTAPAAGGTATTPDAPSTEDDPQERERAAYNEYLRALSADEGRKRE